MFGIRWFRSARMVLPLTSDCPNLSPRPSSACAAAVRVAFSLIGSTCSEIAVIVSNRVLSPVVTQAVAGVGGEHLETSMVSPFLIRALSGSDGEVNETYLLPKTVVASSLVLTFLGSRGRYFGSTSSCSRAFVSSSLPTTSISFTRPMGTPL